MGDIVCPVPKKDSEFVKLAHGGGGRMMHRLIEEIFLSAFDNKFLRQLHDSTVLELGSKKVALTTDSYVIQPLFFRGGDIGSLAVNGTANDLVMSGAVPRYLTAAFVIEEGFEFSDLRKIASSMRSAADRVGVCIVAGDTKVVERASETPALYINTTGIGAIEHEQQIHPCSIKKGDVVVLSGDLGRHGVSVMSMREGTRFETSVESDCAYLGDLVLPLVGSTEIRCLRDLTRGGLATCLNEIASSSGMTIEIRERSVPILEEVRGACEILGLDPLYVANEGRMIAIVPELSVDRVMGVWKKHSQGENAAIIGRVISDDRSLVQLESVAGTRRILDLLSGEQLPRIC